jgi:hypothetical protein
MYIYIDRAVAIYLYAKSESFVHGVRLYGVFGYLLKGFFIFLMFK